MTFTKEAEFEAALIEVLSKKSWEKEAVKVQNLLQEFIFKSGFELKDSSWVM